MSNISGGDGSFSSVEEVQQHNKPQTHFSVVAAANSNVSSSEQQQHPPQTKRKRNLPGTPDPSAEVVALSPTTLMATNRFVCEICNKGFQRDQNLQLHRRGHNLPWKLRQRSTTEVKKRVYICPELTCVHHNPARALGDLTGIKKHFSRKHGEKKWKCDKCSKKYAVQSDWKAHQKTCGTREYKCDCGTIFSRRDSFITHRAFCDALAEENNKVNQMSNMGSDLQTQMPELMSMASMPLNPNYNNSSTGISDYNSFDPKNLLKNIQQEFVPMPFKPTNMAGGMFSSSSGSLFGGQKGGSSSSNLQLSSNNSSGLNYLQDGKNGGQVSGSAHMSATALLQKAAQIGATASNSINSPMMQKSFTTSMAGTDQMSSNTIRTQSQSFGTNHQTPYEHQFNPQEQQSNMVGTHGNTNSGGFRNQMFGGNPSINDMGIFTSMFMGADQDQSFMKNMEQHGDNTSTTNNSTTSSSINGRGNDTLTVDYLGVGGSRPVHLQEQHHHHQQQQLEAMNQQHRLIYQQQMFGKFDC